MRRVSTALVALMAAALVLTAAPALAQPAPSFEVTPTTVLPGQRVTVSGTGCEARAFVDIFFDNVPFERDRANIHGRFLDIVRIPNWADPGPHQVSAKCSNLVLGPVQVSVGTPSFAVNPSSVAAGQYIVVSGDNCQVRSRVIIELDGDVLTADRANRKGSFSKRVRIPKRTPPGPHDLSVSCGRRFIGSTPIQVLETYPAPKDTVSVSQSVVGAGRNVALNGSDCSTRAPVAKLDGQPLAVNVDQNSKGKGFSGTVTIPRGTVPGKHSLYAACDAGSAGTTELQVFDSATTESAADRQPFGGNQSGSNLAIWAGVLVGVALLVASTRIGRRRRS